MAVLPGCTKNDSGTSAGDAPEVPPFAEILSTDLSLFDTSNQPLGKTGDIETKNHFGAAVLAVLAANLFVLAAASVPVIATAATVNVDPTLEPDGKFHWNYNYPSASNPQWSLELTAQVNVNAITWDMFVTSQIPNPDLDNFRWYSGETNIAEETGFLQFYEQNLAGESRQTARADWDYEDETNKTLTFLNNDQSGGKFNDQLMYSVVGDTVKVQYVDASEASTATVAWSRATGAGYIEADNYNNGVRGNWDENRDDIN
jgi:hypothetical protein